MRSKKFKLTNGADFISQRLCCNSGILSDRVNRASSLQDSRSHDAPHDETAKMAVLLNRANPLLPATAEIVDHLWRARAAIPRLVPVSTTLSRHSARTDNDKVARERNEAARRERDCLPGARVCRDRCAEVSIQNAVSTDILRATPSLRTRFASRSVVDTARRTAAGGPDHPV